MSRSAKLSAGRPSAKASKAATLASLEDDGGKVRVNFDLSAAEHRRLKVYAARQGVTIAELLRAYIVSLPD